MNASPAEIESAYVTLVKVWHPDRFQSDQKLRSAAEEKLKEINAAHEYLNSEPIVKKTKPTAPEPQFVPEPEFEPEPEYQFAPPELDEGEPEEVRRLLKRRGRKSRTKFLLRVFVVAGGMVAFVLLWFATDFILSANSTTARPWEELKAEISRDLHATAVRVLGSSADNAPESKNENVQPPAAPAAQESAPAQASAARVETTGNKRPGAAANEPGGARPYLTSGLTPTEVLSILGNPTSSSGEKMFYQGSEIDFRNGHVTGWKIDAKSPIRVKLWPDRPPTPGMATFGVGSSKSDVIALQGTPTLFSDNEFGYGGSVVFFQNDHVVSWKEDPTSVRLRVPH